ncbi:MAG TPA: GspH/FimT family pseudopilin [Woeseiaceae bacterium]|nr:GspH/FimT family pseudopilin [Woeseiaceae bacterium]
MAASQHARGYSLYELLMTLLLVSVILSVGLPSLRSVVASQRLRTEVDRLFHAAHLARQTSIVRRRAVTICASRDASTCDTGGDWSGGWILFVDDDRDRPPQRDAGELLLAARHVDPRLEVRANRRAFTFRTTELRATNGTIVLCDRGGAAAARALVISYSGRPRVTRTDRRGRPYACDG